MLPALGHIGARDPGGELGTQGDAVAAPVLERVHLLGNDVRAFTKRTGENSGRFKHGHFDPVKAIEVAHALKGRDHMREAFLERVSGAPQHVLRAAHRIGCLWARIFIFRHGDAPLTAKKAQGNALFCHIMSRLFFRVDAVILVRHADFIRHSCRVFFWRET